jgi:hypothetical protein
MAKELPLDLVPQLAVHAGEDNDSLGGLGVGARQ